MGNDHTVKNDKRTIFGWAMYDWANSAYSTTIAGAVLPAFFADEIVPEAGFDVFGVNLSGEALWGLATGGGAFCSNANRDLIHGAGGCSVFLDVPWEVVERRLVGNQSGRPKFVDVDSARRLYSDRRVHYLQASWTIDLAGSESPREAAQRIVTVMAGAPCVT